MSEPDDGAPDKTGLRCMLNEKQVLDIVPVSPVTLWRMEKAGRFRAAPSSARTKNSGSKTKSSRGNARSMAAVARVGSARPSRNQPPPPVKSLM
jgi:hypothetical protein